MWFSKVIFNKIILSRDFSPYSNKHKNRCFLSASDNIKTKNLPDYINSFQANTIHHI